MNNIMVEGNTIVNPLLHATGEDVMGFLNEIQLLHPGAISLASGRPEERYFNLQDFHEYFDLFVDSLMPAHGTDRNTVINSLGQYLQTRGIINKLVARQLEIDEGITATPDNLLITVGSQEGMLIAMLTMCNREEDVVLVEDPAYIGLTHLAGIMGYKTAPVPLGEEGMSPERLEEKIVQLRHQGRRTKLVYVIPDCQNPTGHSMPVQNRKRLLELAEAYDFYILEDNAYGQFIYEGTPAPTMKSMDVHKRVIYLGSFSKTIFPSLRLAVMVADTPLPFNGGATLLSELMVKTKAYVTVNTSAITQAVLGGILIRHGCTLKAMNQEKIASLARKRNTFLACLADVLDPVQHSWAAGISWNRPRGGFFITIQLPFSVGKADVLQCVEQHRVIFTPMSFFYHGKGGENEIRIAFSNLSDNDILPATQRLAAYFKSRIINHL